MIFRYSYFGELQLNGTTSTSTEFYIVKPNYNEIDNPYEAISTSRSRIGR
ncbi:hypothetical protein H1P_850001 [Hyella patelloides LEGE 07179]|uniref:Uncharacterized protein n=1 Tax=Hyella patelloides LEGE 07179 TaxID=945734 RepID=A0A563W4N3_9CYAN|nr:hypothetical protein H1P_850001 [Hyella patelloides LEGE 07179]